MRVRVYTDGACSNNPGPGGWAVLVCADDKTVELKGGEPDATNNRMELKAVVEALSYLMSNFASTPDTQFEILSDSAYVVNAINGAWAIKWKLCGWRTAKGGEVKNRDLWEELLQLFGAIKIANVKMKFTKVKGHAGNFFNERVDCLAKEQVDAVKRMA